ncbi:MFS transporter small subunit [Sinomonas sp. P47F7]
MKTARVALGWILVGIPLIYGIATTLVKAAALFG